MDPLILWLAALTIVALITATLGVAIFLLTVLGLLRTFGQGDRGTTIEYKWNHRKGTVLIEKPNYVTNDGRFAPINLTPIETNELKKRAGSHIKVIYILEDSLFQNATQSNTHVYP